MSAWRWRRGLRHAWGLSPRTHPALIAPLCGLLQLKVELACRCAGFIKAHDRLTKNLHEIEHALFDARNSCEKYLAASRYDTRTSFSRELTRTSFSYVCHGLSKCLRSVNHTVRFIATE